MTIEFSTPLYFILSGIYFLVFCIATSFFVHRRSKRPINSRNATLSVISATYGFIHFLNLSIDLSFTENGEQANGWPCYISLCSSVLLLPLWALPYFLRSYKLMFKYYWNLEKVNLSNGKQDNGWHFKNQNRISKPIQFLVLFSAVVIHIVVAVGFAYSNLRPFPNRDCTASQIIGFGILTIFYILALIIFIVRLWPVKDIFSIKTELIIVVFVTVPCFVTWIATIVAPTPGVASSWFAMLVVFLTFLVTICAPLYLSTRNEWNVIPEVDMDEMRILLSTDRASRATVDSEMSEKHPQPKEDTLARYLQNDIYCESFQMFCVQAWCVELYLFYKDCQKYSGLPDSERKQEAERMQQHYINLNSPLELELNDDVRITVQDKIKNDQITQNLFEACLKEVYQSLSQYVYPKWKQSQLFTDAQAKVSAPTNEGRLTIVESIEEGEENLNLDPLGSMNPILQKQPEND